MLDYSEIKERKYILIDQEPFEVIDSHVFRKQQRKPVNQTKLKSLISGRIVEKSFHQSEKVEEADIEKKNVTYLYNNRGEWWFCEEGNPKERFNLPEDLFGPVGKFLKENSTIKALYFDEKVIGIELPIKVELKVKEAPPAVKGNTATGANKQVVLETGAVINAPIFIKEGDIVRVNTETGEYVERITV